MRCRIKVKEIIINKRLVQFMKRTALVFTTLVVLLSFALCQVVFAVESQLSLESSKNDHLTKKKAIVFTLDASNSMNGNDRNRLAIDSIAQLIYSLPSNYYVGVVAYNTDVVAAVGMVDSESRNSIMAAADSVRYIGYTNAGAGLTKAMELLDSIDAVEKTIVMLSDGEIIMQGNTATAFSTSQFQASVTQAKENHVVIHVIGLGDNMENKENTIFSAATETGGSNYHAPKAADIQQAIDAILLDQLHIKKTTAAIVDADGGTEILDINIPTSKATSARILFISDNPIQNLNADFNAENVRQVSGTRYTLLELNHPSAEKVHVSFQGNAGSQVKVDVITEYCVTMIPQVTYEDVEPAEEDATHYERTAQINVSFYDVENPERQVLTDSVFEGKSLSGTIDGQEWAGSLKSGAVSLPAQSGIAENQTAEISVAFDNLETNIIVQQPLTVSLEGAPELPILMIPLVPAEPPDYRPVIIGVVIGILFVTLLLVYLVVRYKRRKPRTIPDPPFPEPSKYDYTGRLNIYITQTKSGRDVPPLTYNLFRIPGGKVLSLQEILDGCNVSEPMEGADRIYFKAGTGRCLVLSNNSDCTIMQNREILLKGRSYLIGLDSKVDITFEDQITEMALQYREVRPNELRSYAHN